MEVILHGDLRRFGERLWVEAQTPREALEKLGIPLEEAWLLAVGERVVGPDEPVEGPLEVYPPIAGGGILEVLP
uniref:MoaD/ThiS family protein n=1 Tax=Thermus tengchongensis TaxID=1214928 RepID=A0A7C6A0K6_9DEIN